MLCSIICRRRQSAGTCTKPASLKTARRSLSACADPNNFAQQSIKPNFGITTASNKFMGSIMRGEITEFVNAVEKERSRQLTKSGPAGCNEHPDEPNQSKPGKEVHND